MHQKSFYSLSSHLHGWGPGIKSLSINHTGPPELCRKTTAIIMSRILKGAYWRKHLEYTYKSMTAVWNSSEQKVGADKFLTQTILRLENLNINRAICIGLGSFCLDSPNPAYPQSLNIMGQFVALESWLKLLEAGGKKMTKGVFIQDPAFTGADREFLESKGYTVLCDYFTAQRLMTPETLLFSVVGNYRQVLLEALSTAHPSLLIGHALSYEDKHVFQATRDGGWKIVLDPQPLSDIKHEPELNAEIERRAINRPFYCARLFRPLFLETAWPSQYLTIDPEAGKPLPSGLEWTWETRIYWSPDDKNLLRNVGIDEEILCSCCQCQRGGLLLPEARRIWRGASSSQDKCE